MDFWNLLFDNEYKQRADIESLKKQSQKRASAARQDLRKIDDLHQRIEQLENHVGELALLCGSLLTILREQGVVSPERFQQVMDRIDAEDGVIDGKRTPHTPPDPPSTPPTIKAW